MSTLFDYYDALDADNLIVVDDADSEYSAYLNRYNLSTRGVEYEIAMRNLFRRIPATDFNGTIVVNTSRIAKEHTEQLREIFYVPDCNEYTYKDVIRDFARWFINVCAGFATEEYINKVLDIIGNEKE